MKLKSSFSRESSLILTEKVTKQITPQFVRKNQGILYVPFHNRDDKF